MLSRRRNGGERDGFGKDRDQQRAFRVSGLCYRFQVNNFAEHIGRLDHHAGCVVINMIDDVIVATRAAFAFIDLDIKRRRQCLRRGGVMRMQTRREDGFGLLSACDAVRHDDRLGAGGRAVIERRVRHIHPGQKRDLRLEFKQRHERALADFGLVRRVSRQEFRALDQVIDCRWDMVTIGPGPAEKRHTTC